MQEYIDWLQRIIIEVREISDLNLQHRVWVMGAGDNYVSSYGEMRCMLFDSYCFDDFLKEAAGIIDSKLIEKLNCLKGALNNYNDKDKTDAQIIIDPSWIKISILAKEIIEYYDKTNIISNWDTAQILDLMKLISDHYIGLKLTSAFIPLRPLKRSIVHILS